MKIIQHFPYSVTLPELIDRQPRGWRWVQEQSKRKRNNVELTFVFKYEVDMGKLSNFVSTINWSKTLSKDRAKAKLISLTTEERHQKARKTMRVECLSTGEVYSYYKLYEEASSPLKYPKKWRNSNSAVSGLFQKTNESFKKIETFLRKLFIFWFALFFPQTARKRLGRRILKLL